MLGGAVACAALRALRVGHAFAWRVGSADAFDKACARSVQTAGPYLLEIDMTAVQPMNITPSAQAILG